MKTYFANAKKILLGCCAVLLVAILILCVFGFNLGHEFNGYIEAKVNIGQYSTLKKDYEKTATKDVLDVLKENDADIITTNIEGSDFTSTLVVTIKKVSKDRSENLAFAKELKTALENHFNDEMYVVETSLVSNVMTDANIIKVVYTVLISLIVLMIYMIFRIRLLNTICVMATSICSMLMLLSLTIITRVQVNLNFIGVVMLTFALSTILAFVKFANIANSRKKDNRYDALTLEEVGEITITDAKSILFCLMILASVIMLIFGSSIVKSYALTVIYALISVWLCDKFVTLPFSYYLSNTTTQKKVVTITEPEAKMLDEDIIQDDNTTNN